MRIAIVLAGVLAGLMTPLAASAQTYTPPPASLALLQQVPFAGATELDADYHKQFVRCDGLLPGAAGKDTFRGYSMKRPNKPDSQQYYLCSRDPSRVEALLKLTDGAVYWESKMALDVDGAWAAWNGIPGATDLKMTSYRWRNITNKESQAAQVDPDVYPFIVMPTAGIKELTGSTAAAKAAGAEFAAQTGLKMGDMGIVIYRDKWTPAFIADGGPFMRLGEGSSKVFEVLGETRCKKWNADKTDCIGTGGYPYRNFGIGSDVIFIMYPGSASTAFRSDNAIEMLCAFAESKLGLTGSATCED